MAYIEFNNVFKVYKRGEVEINALSNTSFKINKGELVCILGPSGAGKTTCLNILGGMDNLTSGEVFVDGKCVNKLNGKELIKYRRNEILNKVGLSNRKDNFPAQLSGGEQQRVAIARAICKNPKLLLCDEPTGALDYITGKQILKLLQDTCRLEHMTVIIITHNSAICPMADKVIKFKNGAVSDVIINKKHMDIKDIEW